MEMSSPLAAMHPPQLPGPWGYRRDLPPSKPLFGAHYQGPKNFNFRDLSMKKPSVDYFNLPRGSSPTASLAADMSSNLHMDQSPQLATPRRSLFTSNIFQQVDNRAAGTTTPPIRWEGVTTPPIPSSSPFVPEDSMDISPLPHKAPYSFLTELTVPSPSPALTSATTDEDMISPCEVPPQPQLPPPMQPQALLPRPASATGRRKSIFNRPSLLRAKNNSTNTVSLKSQAHPCPPFQFNAGVDSFSSTNSSFSLDDCFTESPPQERRPISNPSQGGSKPKPFSLNNFSRVSGSPLGANVRKPAGPMRRPSKVRRSLSMFENSCDVMNSKQDTDSYTPSGLQSVMDIDDAPTLKLPHFVPPNEPDSLPRITSATLVDVLDGVYDEHYRERTIVDCRFEYEYDGGHINGAINHCEREGLAQYLFEETPAANRLIILHCEYSAHRAPLMAKFIRQHDRKVNSFDYPRLTYPEVYILDGGYSAFFAQHRNRCFPQNYCQMDAPDHLASCEKGMNKLRHRSKLNRAQTFAYGMQTCQMEDSPTAVGRSRSGGVLTLGDDIFNVDKPTRRMASY
ncbi:Rhodanese-like protein [Lentithecium fluviatile CBS 122367]|uniref:M-phase inducer phosphatase n=1 Tax=Lentithecium fluviatile CBS 122367 TaxID=1168545 RepID=A0A6G1JCC1_9PLEO|nr:Rhodanese-like protein [Lentithecium fluviatile CBS 122367]